ncbi:von Willebrand factor type A domain-containing protein [Thermosyntropha lipolytica DSM 11003]|uniref:von Willebrand factor type A domain-containing protein n=1 Tax=Thermosyntropha lipolytica DSM 11003 TaxID=1123382 RepID=A0A1M5RZF2_9FIRM|nr:vWA domain-containing protein [Thermosyntropha lipolytica]SHH31544.1 von Willebrand factor type A domain-containing protein [Thermosyntropha lipolytica DSM 11003]
MEKNLFLLIDNSSSMWDRDINTSLRKIDLLREKLLSFLQGKMSEFEEIFIYSFANSLKYEGTTNDLKEIEKTLRHMSYWGSSSRIWDSINNLINQIQNKNRSILGRYLMDDRKSIILCVTDGEDNSSIGTYEEIINKISKLNNIEVIIIDLSGDIKKNKKSKRNVYIEDKLEKIEEILNENKKNMDINFSVAVLPIVPTKEDDIEIVRKMLLKSIPYIEKLTGLRYYPVPTFIVDKYMIKDYIETEIIDKDNNELELREDIKEIIKFILSVSLTFHTDAFIPENIGMQLRSTEYEDFHNLSKEGILILKASAETAYNLSYILNDRFDVFFEERNNSYIYISELSTVKDPIINCYDDLKYMEMILKRINERYRNDISLSGEYFYVYGNRGAKPILEIWRKYTSNAQFTKLVKCVDEMGYWKKDLKSILVALEIAINIIFNMLKRMKSELVKYKSIVSTIHTYGVYILPTIEKKQLINKLKSNGYPEHFYINKTGVVLLCLDEIKKRIEEVLQEDASLDKQKLKEDLILATLIHEHTHAAVYEGLNYNSSSIIFNNSNWSSGKRFKAVSEGLAEWAELNYFRNNKVMYDIIYNHAVSGEFPDWPYSAAVLIEDSYLELGDIKYKALVEYFRRNYIEAYKLLVGR